MDFRWRRSATSLALALCANALAVYADEPPATIPVDAGEDDQAPQEPARLEDLVVTAGKREGLQRELPGSVGVLEGDLLEEARAQGMRDYLRLVPGVAFNDQGTESSVPAIRGIATEIGFGSTAQTTGVYLDDMPFADLFVPLSLPDLHPFDLERVEVLKGPQGTLFGSGALSGAVRYVTRKPAVGLWEAKLFETRHRADQSDDATEVTAGAVNVPLFDNQVAVRAVGLRRRGAGTYDMSARDSSGAALRADPDADRSEQWSGRGLISWRPSERLSMGGLVFRQDTHFGDVALADQPAKFESLRTPFASPREYNFGGANVLAAYDFDKMRLVSSSNGLRKHNRLLTHAEWFFDMQDQNQNEWYDLALSDVDGFTQEFRLMSTPDSDVSWITGASYLRYAAEYFQYEPEPGPAGAPPPEDRNEVTSAERAQSFLFATIDSVSVERAAFGEVTFPFAKAWELTAGARIYETRMTADTVISGAQVVALTQQTEARGHFVPRDEGVNPKVALRYVHNDQISLYALAAKGFQFGGVQVNPSAPILSQSSEQAGFHFGPYDSSTLWNYEAGLRTEWLGRRIRFDVGAFYLDWRDLQLTVRVPILGTASTFGVIANVGRAHSEGLETALDVLLFDGCRWTSTAAWLSAVTDVDFDEDNPQGPVRAGTRLPGSPHFQWANVVSYRHAIPSTADWVAGIHVTHTHVGTATDAIRETGSIGGYDALDVGFTLSLPARFQPEVFVAGNNVTNAHASTYHSRLASVSGQQVDFYHFLEPRSAVLGIKLQY